MKEEIKRISEFSIENATTQRDFGEVSQSLKKGKLWAEEENAQLKKDWETGEVEIKLARTQKGKLAAFSLFFLKTSELTLLHVLPEFRRIGLATRMIKELMREKGEFVLEDVSFLRQDSNQTILGPVFSRLGFSLGQDGRFHWHKPTRLSG